MQSIALVTKEPSVLPQASEELIHDAKASINLYPESPGGGSGSQGGGCSNSLGSRKSSVCSISSMNSSGSSNSPGHHHYPRSLSQVRHARGFPSCLVTIKPAFGIVASAHFLVFINVLLCFVFVFFLVCNARNSLETW